jgi:hypothetical protein
MSEMYALEDCFTCKKTGWVNEDEQCPSCAEASPIQIVWGRDSGYCAWCVDEFVDDEPIWEYAIDSQDTPVKYACCLKCADERDVTY